VVNDGEGLVDEMRGFSVKSRVRSSRSIASYSGREKWLETRAASVVFGMMALASFWGSLRQTKATRT
jgi:hypothetical protein